MWYRLRGLFLLFFILILTPGVASAQTAATATLTAPNLEAFPRVQAYLDVRDAQGNFVHDLQAADIQILEDGNSFPPKEVTELNAGLQVVVAINPGASFGVRNSQGRPRYNFLQDALQQWAKNRQGSNQDDWSLLITNSTGTSHISNPIDWLGAFQAAQVDLRSANPSPDTIFQAVDLAADPTPRPGMGRAVLLITSPLEGKANFSPENLITRAQQQQVHVSIWMVSGAGAQSSQSVKNLTQLAEQTGGKFFAYTGEETVPSPEDFLASLRSIYSLVYDSSVKTSGVHQLAAEVQTADGKVTTAPQNFDIQVQPPDPAFIAPVMEIHRAPPKQGLEKKASNAIGLKFGSQDDEILIADYLPTQQELQILVDFPDGRVRPLARTSLLVDGVVVAENKQPPFDHFTWDLKNYTANGQHVLKVQAEDGMGMTGSSIDNIVQIIIDHPAANPWQALYRNLPAIAGLSVVLLGAFLLLILIVGGRLRPSTQGVSRKANRKKDPVTQPVRVHNEPAARRLSNPFNRLQWPQRHVVPTAQAFLSRLTEGDTVSATTPIPIIADEITIGSDPNLATLVLNDSSVEPLHARLVRKESGAFRLADEGSIAGTWINYTPVSQEGTQLEHGDLVHIGRVGFRFTLRQPSQVRKPVVTLTGETPLTAPQPAADQEIEKPTSELQGEDLT